MHHSPFWRELIALCFNIPVLMTEIHAGKEIIRNTDNYNELPEACISFPITPSVG
jgi:hypothetical protein